MEKAQKNSPNIIPSLSYLEQCSAINFIFFVDFCFIFCFSFQHPFLGNVKKKAVMALISEAKAEVVETVEDLTEEEDIKEIKVVNM